MSWLGSLLKTDRLYLRPLVKGDEAPIASLFSDPEVRRYLGGALSREQAESRAQVVSQGTTDRFWGVFALCEASSSDVIGMASFDDQRGRWQVSYELLPAWWGQGLAFEAVSAMLLWFWAQRPEVDDVVAVTQTANARSCRLLERLGGRRGREFEEFGETQCEYVFERRVESSGVTA